jgi:uncharacterized RmlC-like cupin family protein
VRHLGMALSPNRRPSAEDADAAASARLIRPEDRREADPTPGMRREVAVETERLWSGVVTTDPGASSAWHHHGDHDTVIYVAQGSVRLESGPGGRAVVDAVAGEFVEVPPWAVHRELNPGTERSELVVVRAGTGPTTTNVDGPAPVD